MEMHDQLRSHVEQLFSNAPQTKKARELKEELYDNLAEKYNDLIAGGISPEAALDKTVDSIGDVHELIRSLEEEIMMDPEQYNVQRRKNARVVTLSVLLYMVSLISLVVMSMFPLRSEIMFCVFIILAAIPTALLIYNYMSQPRYRRADDTLVEEFKEFSQTAGHNKTVWKSLAASYWCLVVVVYFAVSFFVGGWAWSWLIFLLAAALQGIIKALLDLRK